ncbi:hypothetical protein LC087_02070 [Bacillus carboniphilus]|uniref:Class III signal peptide-containing protein n=1 Tax=Bacillus carboniphilus TaxID=86663 RepID=A0ABY9JUE7_9BACI|nr:hypothetical protein [Bacillus carboniphilus]WLR43029.1 hypothetical protein LC087_02070 [Bacillus carboniphilus]
MNYVKPTVELNNEMTSNEAIEWAIVAIVAIVVVGGYAAYCTATGANFDSAFNFSDQEVSIGCSQN